MKTTKVENGELLHIIYLAPGNYNHAKDPRWASFAWEDLGEACGDEHLLGSEEGEEEVSFLTYDCPGIEHEARSFGLEVVKFQEIKVVDCPFALGTADIMTNGTDIYVIDENE